MANQQARLLSGAEQIVHALHLQRVASGCHGEITHGISLTARIRILVTRVLKSGDLVQGLQVIERSHQLCMARVQQNDIVAELRQGILLAAFQAQMVLSQLLRNGIDYDALFIQLLHDLRRKGFLQDLAGTAHGTDASVRFLSLHLFHSGKPRNRYAASETGASQHAHGASISIFAAVVHRTCCSGGIDENIALINISVRILDVHDSVSVLLKLRDSRLQAYPYAEGKDISGDRSGNGGHIVQIRMRMAGELDIFMPEILFDHAKQLAAAHGDHLLRGGIPSIISHDAANQTGSKQHIGPFQKGNLRPQLSRFNGSRTAGPAAACNHNLFHDCNLLFIIFKYGPSSLFCYFFQETDRIPI